MGPTLLKAFRYRPVLTADRLQRQGKVNREADEVARAKCREGKPDSGIRRARQRPEGLSAPPSALRPPALKTVEVGLNREFRRISRITQIPVIPESGSSDESRFRQACSYAASLAKPHLRLCYSKFSTCAFMTRRILENSLLEKMPENGLLPKQKASYKPAKRKPQVTLG